VAVRESITLTFMYGDHLGSASPTTNVSGAKVSEVRYYPFGETRYSSGTVATSKRFTSQEQQADIGLYDYGARFYDSSLGRFISADTVVPRWNDPQSLNRYTYVRNSPITRIDPTGHGDCNVHTTSGCKPWWIADRETKQSFPSAMKRSMILATGRGLKENSDISSLEKFARLAEYAAGLYKDDDTDNFMSDLTYVILGWSRPTNMVQPNIRGDSGDWLGLDVFVEWSGWKSEYTDKATADQGKNNQMFHFWFYVAASYFDGPSTASVANQVHEIPIYQGTIPGIILGFISPILVNGGNGTSKQDYDLGERGVELGYGLNYAAHQDIFPPTYRPLMPSEVANWLRTNLGETK
jgi:RHS repeat-associated protein